jgi:YVTN family beta-propeller protein
VADTDSDQVSVISTSSEKVTGTIPLSGGPDTLALTPDGSQLWVGGLTSAIVTVLDTATQSVVGSINAEATEPTPATATSRPASC